LYHHPVPRYYQRGKQVKERRNSAQARVYLNKDRREEGGVGRLKDNEHGVTARLVSSCAPVVDGQGGGVSIFLLALGE